MQPTEQMQATDALSQLYAEAQHMLSQLYAEAQHIRHRAGLQQETGGAMVGAYGRPSLRERVNSSFHRAAGESQKLDPLRELADLLDTNPAIARILELIEATGV